MSRQVFEKVYRIELPIPFALKSVNVFFIDDRPRTLIDTGLRTEASFEALRTGLEANGFGLRSIERILITHGHIDHYGQAKRLSSLTGAPVYIHPTEYGKIRSVLHALGRLKSILSKNGVPEPLVNEVLHSVRSSQKMGEPLEEALFLNDGDVIPFASMRLQAIHCPGHSQGMLCFHWPEGKLLFTGDHLLKEITPNPVLEFAAPPASSRYCSLKEYLGSLKKMERLDVSLLLPGHGDEIKDVKGLVRKVFAHHKERMDLVLSHLSKGERTAFEIAVDLFRELRAFEVFLGISEVVGHLEILREKGKVRLREREGLEYYSLSSIRNLP